MTPLGEHAIKIATKGLRVFPCVERGKEPAIHANLKNASIDPNIIGIWWHSRNFNIAIATGEESGVWVLDIDGDEGETTLRRLEAEHGSLPNTVEAITGKGRHLYWRWPSGTTIRNRQVNPNMPGIDVRANGGYVLVPPSIHPSGRAYAWSVDSRDSFEDAPQWLLDLIQSSSGSALPAIMPEQWWTFLEEHVEGSRRGAAIARLYGLLARRYIDPAIAFGIVQLFNEARCHPPLDLQEVQKIAAEIAHREAAQVRNRR